MNECVIKNIFLVDCVMGEWGSWTSCGTSCSARDGSGTQVRTRSPNIYAAHGGADCTEDTQEDRDCSNVCPGILSSLIFALDKPMEYKLFHFSVDCKMGTWGSWESCGTSCRARDGTGVQTRTRSPNLYAANNGADCTESTSDNRACSVVCPGNV